MLALISPAKKLDFESDVAIADHTQPDFLEESERLVAAARKLSRAQLASTMHLSDKLTELNFKRFRDFTTPFDLANAKQAALVFNGDTYVGLKADTLSEKDMAYAQDHLRILSGLYGMLRPLDLIQPYRLEMGAKFRAPGGTDLYGFWDGQLAEAINEVTAGHKDPTVANLASNEYFKAVQAKKLASNVITPVFKEIKDGQARTLGMFAKRARGAMARFMIKKRIEKPDGLKKFNEDGYEYRDDLSEGNTWVFTREQPPAKS
jgi:cytoplasmic iron level regulating protein YaaA (DUF328/UPF0246 family)